MSTIKPIWHNWILHTISYTKIISSYSWSVQNKSKSFMRKTNSPLRCWLHHWKFFHCLQWNGHNVSQSLPFKWLNQARKNWNRIWSINFQNWLVFHALTTFPRAASRFIKPTATSFSILPHKKNVKLIINRQIILYCHQHNQPLHRSSAFYLYFAVSRSSPSLYLPG